MKYLVIFPYILIFLSQAKGGSVTERCVGHSAGSHRIGQWTCYFPSGKRQSILHYNKSGKRDGAIDFWNGDGSKSFTSQWKDGYLDGRLIRFNPAGKPKLESHFRKGALDGVVREWDDHDILRVETNYQRGSMNGLAREWNENGKLKSEGNYINENMDGPYSEWWDTGQLRRQGQFKKGLKVGFWRYFNKSGQPVAEREDGALP